METSKNIIAPKVAEIELVYKTKVKASDIPKITRSDDAKTILMDNWDTDKIEFIEQFKVMYLNRNSKVTGIVEISTGGTSATIVDVKLIYAGALKANVSSIIIAHNHPSGNLKPSPQDIRLTEKLKKAGEILDISIIDHLIITKDNGYFSFADEGLI
ncbi:RadC family protein [Belliella pelovolcani]|uniref:JAB domain-containing protein n=1 Tax=Belliella pelovolcani TaxID=529505 RepID=UPI00391CD6BE